MRREGKTFSSRPQEKRVCRLSESAILMPQEKVRATASIEEKLRKRLSSGERANKMRAGTARVLRNFVPHVGSELPRDFEQVVRGKQEKCTGNTRQERPRKRERRNAEKEKSDAFDENHVGMRSSLA